MAGLLGVALFVAHCAGAAALSLPANAPAIRIGNGAVGLFSKSKGPAQYWKLQASMRGSPRSLKLRGGATTSMSLVSQAAKTGIAVYGILIGGGGIKTGSKPSIISSAIASILLAVAFKKDNIALALGTAVSLAIVFAIRFAKTRKIMPAAVLGTLSLLFSILFAFAQFKA